MALTHIEKAVEAMNLSPTHRKKLVKAMDKDFEELRILATQDASVIAQELVYYTLLIMGCNDQFINRFSKAWSQTCDDVADQIITIDEMIAALNERGIALESPN